MTQVDDRPWAEINGYRYGGIDEAFIERVLETHIPHPRYRSDSQTNPAEVFRQVITSPYCRARVESEFWCEVIVHGDRGPGADGQADPLGVGRWRIRLWRHCSTVTPVHEAAHVLAGIPSGLVATSVGRNLPQPQTRPSPAI